MAKVAPTRPTANILNNEFSRGDEGEADEKGVQLANKVGYAPTGLASALTKLTERNKDVPENRTACSRRTR